MPSLRSFAEKNMATLLKGGGMSIFATGATYCLEASRFKSDVAEARAATARGRAAYVQGRTSAAKDDMDTAKHSIMTAQSKLQHGLLTWWEQPALWWAGLSRPSLNAYVAHIFYHCAVLKIHARDIAAAIELLDESCKLRRDVAGNNPEYARAITRRGDIASLSDVRAAKKAYEEAIKIADADASFFSARARNNFGILWHALGYDAEACRYFRAAAESADDVSAPTVEACCKLAQSPSALVQLRKLGRGETAIKGAATTLDDEIVDLLKKSRCGAVDVDFIGPADAPQIDLERLERLKLSWRKRVTARTNLLNVHAASDQTPAHEIDALLGEICATASRHAAGGRTTVLFHPAYCALDSEWLAGGGKVRIATSIAAGLTELLKQGHFTDDDERSRAVALARSAFALVKAQVHGASTTHQGLYQYHFAKFELENGGQIEVVDRFIDQAILNHGGGLGQHVPSQRDARLLAEAYLLQGTAHPEMSARATLDVVRQFLANGTRRDTRMQNADHPVLLRATSRLRVGDAPPASLAHAAARHHVHGGGKYSVLGLVDSTLEVLRSSG